MTKHAAGQRPQTAGTCDTDSKGSVHGPGHGRLNNWVRNAEKIEKSAIRPHGLTLYPYFRPRKFGIRKGTIRVPQMSNN
jgi:hypothetical protein